MMANGTSAMQNVLRGCVSGLVATALMSAVFVVADRSGVIGRKPPRLIVDHFFPGLSAAAADRLAVLGHFGYGAAGGLVFDGIGRRVVGGSAAPSVARGLVFGVLLWAASYEGWVPAAGVLPPAHRDGHRRSLTILAAHVVYGLALGLVPPTRR